MRWVNAKGEEKVYEVAVKPETFPVLEKDQEYTFKIGVHQEHATLTATRFPRREIDRIAYQDDMAKREKIYKRFKAQEKDRLRPYLEKAQRDYIGWDISDVFFRGRPIFSYSKDNVVVKLMVIDYKEYGKFPIHVSISRAERELNQTGDDREGGLLIVDEEGIILGISLFKYDNEPLAANFFGEVRIERFRELLINEEAVLSEERDGLLKRHPFCQVLIPEIEKSLSKMVE